MGWPIIRLVGGRPLHDALRALLLDSSSDRACHLRCRGKTSQGAAPRPRARRGLESQNGPVGSDAGREPRDGGLCVFAVEKTQSTLGNSRGLANATLRTYSRFEFLHAGLQERRRGGNPLASPTQRGESPRPQSRMRALKLRGRRHTRVGRSWCRDEGKHWK